MASWRHSHPSHSDKVYTDIWRTDTHTKWQTHTCCLVKTSVSVSLHVGVWGSMYTHTHMYRHSHEVKDLSVHTQTDVHKYWPAVLYVLYSTVSVQQMNLLPENASWNDAIFLKSLFYIILGHLANSHSFAITVLNICMTVYELSWRGLEWTLCICVVMSWSNQLTRKTRSEQFWP